jgi:exosortase H (IPTLxxWG-CTERM-specific)
MLCYYGTLNNNAKGPIRLVPFILIFTVCFLVGFGLLFTAPVQSADAELSRLLVKASQQIIQVCGGHATRDAAILRAPNGFAIEMRDGCNAVNVTILLWSAMLAFPASFKMRAAGLAAGTALIQAANIVRFISLFYLGQYSRPWFDFAHAYLWESLLVLDTLVVFWIWVSRTQRIVADAHQA